MTLVILLFTVGWFGYILGYNHGNRAHHDDNMDPDWLDDFWRDDLKNKVNDKTKGLNGKA